MREMALQARREDGEWPTNSWTNAPVSAYRFREVPGWENWLVPVRVCDIVGMPYVWVGG